MEQLVALAAFGMLGAIAIFGYLSSERGARERKRSARDLDSSNGTQTDE